jgi:glycosyltransferase involved in cell wall biosynthesis
VSELYFVFFAHFVVASALSGMKVVVVTPYRVVPPDNGGKELICGVCEELQRQTAFCACLALCTLKESRRPPPPPAFPYQELPAATSPLLGFKTAPFLGHIPYLWSLRFYARALARRIQSYQPQIVDVTFPWLTALRRWLPPDVKLVLQMQNIETVWYGQATRTPALIRWLARIEREGLAQADYIVCLTAADRDGLMQRYGVPAQRLSVIPPGFTVAAPPGADAAPTPARPTAVFFGSSIWSNRAAALTLLRDVAPRCPAMDFLLAGRVCEGLRGASLPANARLAGFVEDLDGLLARCDVLVNPTEMPTGINMKVGRALARGLRVVSTPSGAQGYEDLIGDPIRIGPLERFPQLLQDARRLTPAELERVRAAYAWPAVVRRRLELYQCLLRR